MLCSTPGSGSAYTGLITVLNSTLLMSFCLLTIDSSSEFEFGPDSDSDIIKYSDIKYNSDPSSDFRADIIPLNSDSDSKNDDILPDLCTNDGIIIPFKKSYYHDPGTWL